MVLARILIYIIFFVWILGTLIYFERKEPSKTMLAAIKSIAMSVIILFYIEFITPNDMTYRK